jgi:hypothetical protein
VASESWVVRPHGSLDQLEPNLWRAEGSLAKVPMKRVMTIARLSTGALVVHNPIAMADDEMARIDGLGPVSYLVVPNGWHRLDAPAFAARYPSAVTLAPAGSLKRVRAMVPAARDLRDGPADPAVSLGTVAGTKDAEALMTVRSGSHTSVVFADAVFNMPHRPGVSGFVLKHVTQSSGGPKTSRIARLFVLKDKAAFAAQLDQLATPGLTRVIVAHEDVIDRDPAGALRSIAASLR